MRSERAGGFFCARLTLCAQWERALDVSWTITSGAGRSLRCRTAAAADLTPPTRATHTHPFNSSHQGWRVEEHGG